MIKLFRKLFPKRYKVHMKDITYQQYLDMHTWIKENTTSSNISETPKLIIGAGDHLFEFRIKFNNLSEATYFKVIWG